MKKCIVLVMLSVLIISSSVVTAFAAYSTMSRSIDVDLVKMKALQLYYGRFDANWLLVVNPKTTTLSNSWVVDIGMENLNDLIYEANSCGVTTQKYEYKDGWYCAIVSGGYFVKDGVVVGGSPYYTWGNVNGYAYVAQEENIDIEIPSVDMSDTNNILGAIYNQFYEYSFAQNALLSRVYGKLSNTNIYLDYINTHLSLIYTHLDAINSNMVQAHGAMITWLENINNNIKNYGDWTLTVLYDIKELLETGIPVTGVDIGDVTVSTDLTNVEGYIDEVESYLISLNNETYNIGTLLSTQNGYLDTVESKLQTINSNLTSPTGQPFGRVLISTLNTTNTTLSSILAELQNDTSTGGATDLTNVEGYIDGLEGALSTIDSRLADIENAVYSNATDLTNVEGYIDQLESKLDEVNSNLRIGQLPAVFVINSGIATTNNRLSDIYTRLESIEDVVLDAENTIIDITTDNDAFNIFYVEKTDGTSESVGETATDAAKVVGEFLSVFYRLIFADGLENADIIHDFEEVYTVTDSGVSVW